MRLGILSGEAISADHSPTPHLPYVFVDIPVGGPCDGEGLAVYTDLDLPEGAALTLCAYDPDKRRWDLRHVRAGKTLRSDDGPRLSLTRDPEDGGAPRPGLEFLMRSPFLEAISQKSFLAFVNCLEKRVFAPGEVLAVQGADHQRLYLIESGVCEAGVETGGKVHHVAELKTGDLAGELPVLTGGPSDMHIAARTEVATWAMDRDAFDRLARTNPDLRVFLTEALTARLESCPVEADRIIGKFRISRRLGSGGWGMVYLGEHASLRMPAAIKMLKHSMSLDPIFSETFRREAETIATLAHENIVRVYDIEEAYRTIFIIMEYLEGESLVALLDRMGRLDPARTENILVQILRGLGHAHEKGVIHRDIKPDNIFLLPGDKVKILDFGLACPPGTEDMSLAGTVYYAPPEQIEGDPVDARSDLYSAGIMAYQMVCGERPYPEDDLSALMDLRCAEDIPDPARIVPDLPERLRAFILSCSARSPGARPDSATTALSLLTGDAAPLAESPRRLMAIYLSHDAPRAPEIDDLLESFSLRAKDLGASLKLVDLQEAWDRP